MMRRGQQPGARAVVMGLFCACVSACGGGGDPDASVDTGLFTPFDAGPPVFVDANVDAGAPAQFRVRLAHQIAGMAGTEEAPGSAHVCVWLVNGDALLPIPPRFLTQATGPIPFRGVSPYLPLESVAPLDYQVGLYEPGDVTTGCPSDPELGPAPVLLERLQPDDVPVESVSTILAIGLLPGALGAEEGESPALCNPTPNPVPCDRACPGALGPRLLVAEDDLSPVASGIRLRASNQIQNLAPVGFNVCYEPSLAPDASGPAGACIDTVPDDSPTMLFANVTPGTVTDPIERAPLTPTGAGFGGGIYLVPETTGATGCPPFAALPSGTRCLPILAAFPDAPPSPNIRPQLVDGDIATLFITGVLGLSGEDDARFGSLQFLWQDNL